MASGPTTSKVKDVSMIVKRIVAAVSCAPKIASSWDMSDASPKAIPA